MNEIALRQTDDYSSLMVLAKELCTTGFLPAAVKTPAQAVAIILTGRELGLPPMQSLRSICIIQGKPELSADLQLSIFHRDGGRSKWLELTPLVAKLLLKHPNGDEHTETFTMEDARRAGLASGMNWQKYPKAMLRSRAITAGLKSIGFEPLTGAYAPGEIGGPEVVDPEPATVSAEPIADPPQPQTLSQPTRPETPHKTPTAKTRAFVLDELGAVEGGTGREILTKYLRALGWLDADKEVEQWPINTVPESRKEIDKLKLCLGQFQANPEKVITPYPPHSTGAEPPPAPAQKTSSWANHIVPAGKHKGKPLHRVPTEDIKHLWSTNQFTDADLESQELPPEVIETMKRLREALGLAAAELGFTRKETV